MVSEPRMENLSGLLAVKIQASGHTARGSGVDVSSSFTVGSKSYPALPGFEPGYFSGGAPNMGHSQE